MAIPETSPLPVHPNGEDLQRFARGELSRREVREIVRHLLTGCPRCRRLTAALWGPVGVGERINGTITGGWAGERRVRI
jgi:hypothetical protein